MPATTWLDKLLGRIVKAAGSVMPSQPAINFTGAGVSVSDDPTNQQTTVNIPGAAAGGSAFTLDSGSGALAAGDWVCPLATDPTKVTRATPAVALAAGAILGCVKATVAPGASCIVFGPGAVVAAANFSDLAGSGVSNLQMGPLGRAQRQAHWSGGEIKCGTVDASGNVTVDPLVPIQRSPVHEYSPITYGAVADAWQDSNQRQGGTDDTLAWHTMIAAIAADTTPGKKKIKLPPRPMYIAGIPYVSHDTLKRGMFKLEIPVSVHVEGNGGGGIDGISGIGASGFVLAPGCAILFCNKGASTLSATAGLGAGGYSHYEYVSHRTNTIIFADTTPQNTYSTLGVAHKRSAYRSNFLATGHGIPKGALLPREDIVINADGGNGVSHTDGSQTHGDVMFRCNVAFNPGASAPAKFTTATTTDLGTSFDDTDNSGATVTGAWTVESVPLDRSNGITAAFDGAVVVPGQRFLVPGDARYIFEVVTGGTLAARTGAGGFLTNQGYLQPAPWQRFSDGSATVMAMMAGTIQVLDSDVLIQHCTFQGGIGGSVQIEGGGLDGIANNTQENWAVADFCTVNDIRIRFSFGGVSDHGAEANICRVYNMRMSGPSLAIRTQGPASPGLTKGLAGLADGLVSHGDGGFGVWIRNFGVHTANECYYLVGLGVGYIADSSTNAAPGLTDPAQGAIGIRFINCVGENTLQGNIISNGAMFDYVASNITNNESSAGMIISPSRTRGLMGVETDTLGHQTQYAVQENGLGPILSYDLMAGRDIPRAQRVGRWTDKVGSFNAFTDRVSSFASQGWLIDAHGPQSGNLGFARAATAISYGDARNTTTASTITATFSATNHTMTRSSGSFITDGFMVGDIITIANAVNGGNNGTKTITALTATVMTFASGLVNETNTAGVTVTRSPLGPGVGLHAIFDGYFNRVLNGATAGYYHATDANMLQDVRLRYGFRVVGDTFPIPGATHAPGTFRRCAVATAGYRAPKWTSGTAYVVEDDTFYYVEATTVEEPSTPAVFSDGTTYIFKFVGGTTSNNGVLPNFSGNRSVGNTFTDANGAQWKCLGATAIIRPTDFVDNQDIGLSNQADLDWDDSAATTTVAPKAGIKSRRRSIQTTTSGTNQTLLTSFAFDDNSAAVFSVQVEGKRNGAHESFVRATLSYGVGRNNGGNCVLDAGTSSVSTWGAENSLVGTTFDVVASGTAVLVRVNNPPAYAVDWGIEVQAAKGMS